MKSVLFMKTNGSTANTVSRARVGVHTQAFKWTFKSNKVSPTRLKALRGFTCLFLDLTGVEFDVDLGVFLLRLQLAVLLGLFLGLGAVAALGLRYFQRGESEERSRSRSGLVGQRGRLPRRPKPGRVLLLAGVVVVKVAAVLHGRQLLTVEV